MHQGGAELDQGQPSQEEDLASPPLPPPPPLLLHSCRCGPFHRYHFLVLDW